MKAKSSMGDACEACLVAGGAIGAALGMRGHYDVECFGADGQLKWRDTIENLVPTAGLNKYLDATLKTGLTTPAWYVALVTGPGGSNTYAAGDTMGSHAGWAENTSYSESVRQTFTPGSISAGSVSNTASKAVFTINGSVTLAGCFVADVSTKAGTTGTLLSVGNFSGGDRAVVSGDQVNVTFTATATAS